MTFAVVGRWMKRWLRAAIYLRLSIGVKTDPMKVRIVFKIMNMDLKALILQGEHSDLRVQWGSITHVHRDRRHRPEIAPIELPKNMKRRRKLPTSLRDAYPGELWVTTGFFIIPRSEISRWNGPSAMRFGVEGISFHVVSLIPWMQADGAPLFKSDEASEAWNFRALCRPTPAQIARLTGSQGEHPVTRKNRELASSLAD